MEVKIKILEILPKIAQLKSNYTDFFSMSFEYDNYKVNIEDIEKTINNRDEIIINLKESSFSKNDIKQFIKFSLIKNNKNISYILGSSEILIIDGVKWYTVKEVKNDMVNKESFITSSTSNNLQNTSELSTVDCLKLINNLNSSSSTTLNSNMTIKIKFSINTLSRSKQVNRRNKKYESPAFSNRLTKKSFYSSKTKKNVNKLKSDLSSNYTSSKNKLIQNNCIIKPSLNSSNENIFDKDLLNDELFKVSELETINIGDDLTQRKFLFNFKNINDYNSMTIVPLKKNNKISKHKSYFNQIINKPKLNNGKENRRRCISPLNKMRNDDNTFPLAANKKEKNKLKTQIDFYKKKDRNKEGKEEKLVISNSIKEIKDIKYTENIEDEIIDQSFKNNLKNDEMLRHITNSSTSNNLENIKTEKGEDEKNEKEEEELYKEEEKKEEKEENKEERKEENEKCDINNINKITGTESEFEELKNGFNILYSEDYIKQVKNDDLIFELKSIMDKLFILQSSHQKEYIDLFNDINLNNKIIENSQFNLVVLSKRYNKLKTKILYRDYKKFNFIENLHLRKNILLNEEIPIWNKMTQINPKNTNNSLKNKMREIFIEIYERNKNKLSKLSKKFSEEIKLKYNITPRFKTQEIEEDKKSVYTSYKITNAYHKITNNYENKNDFVGITASHIRHKSNISSNETNNNNYSINNNSSNNNYKKKFSYYRNKEICAGDKVYRKKKGIYKNQ